MYIVELHSTYLLSGKTTRPQLLHTLLALFKEKVYVCTFLFYYIKQNLILWVYLQGRNKVQSIYNLFFKKRMLQTK